MDSLGKFDYGQHMQAAPLYLRLSTKWVNPMEIAESSYKWLNSCFEAIALFHKVY